MNHNEATNKKTKIILDGKYVTLEYDDKRDNTRVKREFFIGFANRVCERTRNNYTVCEYLYPCGRVIIASDPNDLLRVIRYEFSRMRKRERLEARQYYY